MTRSRLAWPLLLLAACPSKTGEATQSPGSTPIVELPATGKLPIVLVPQRPAVQTELWTFEPGGARIASTEYGDCGVWDVASGRLIHVFELADGSPCVEWPAATSVFELARLRSADERLELDGADVLGPDGQVLRSLACAHCGDAVELSWAPQGHQVALVFLEPPRIEVWDADTGRKLASEPLAAAAEPFDLDVAWTLDRPFAAWGELELSFECDETQDACEWDDEGNVVPREVALLRVQALGRPPILVGQELGGLDVLQFDVEGRYVMWTHSWDERRAGTTDYVEVAALDGSPTGLSSETYTEYDDYEGSTMRHGEWRDDGALHYAIAIEDMDYEGSPLRLAWEELVVSPPLGRSSGTIVDDLPWGAVVEVATLGLVDGGVRTRGIVCHANDQGVETCSSIGVVAPPDCELLDVGSGHGAELYDCGGRVMLRSGGKQHVLPLDAPATFWWWMRGGALVLHDGERFMIVDAASGAVGVLREDVAITLDAKLGSELDRVLVINVDGFEVIDTRTLQVVTRVIDGSLVDAALAPAGDRLAQLDSDQIIVRALPSGEVLGRFPNPDEGVQIAYRQDGAALWVGSSEAPSVLLDAASGEPREHELVKAIATALREDGELDPSWRFVVNDELGTLMRTLDARELVWIGEGRSTAVVPETGQYEGPAPGAEYAFRVGHDSMAVPEFDAASLAKALELPDLVERFLRGEPIPAPTIDASELAAVRASIERRRTP